MHRILSACIDIAASMIFILPVFAICNKFIFHKAKHTALYVIFSFYLIAVMSLVGLPNVRYMRIDFSVNIIPFIDMISDMKNALLNILLFIPMGFLLPIFWRECRQLKHTATICLCVTIIIELLQIFTFRTTDINDIITNTLGGVIGFFISKKLTNNFSKLVYSNSKYYEMYIVFAISFLIMFFAVPFTSNLLQEIML